MLGDIFGDDVDVLPPGLFQGPQGSAPNPPLPHQVQPLLEGPSLRPHPPLTLLKGVEGRPSHPVVPIPLLKEPDRKVDPSSARPSHGLASIALLPSWDNYLTIDLSRRANRMTFAEGGSVYAIVEIM